MRYIDEYNNKRIINGLIDNIHQKLKGYSKKIVLMEVCGTHTMSIFRSGLKELLPRRIELLSGPGCPVCVTPNHYIDKAIAYSRVKDTVITTFGDMMRVPGSVSTLEKEKAKGANVVVVYSPLDALTIAKLNPNKKVVFLGIGFETTAPLVASTIETAKKSNVRNFFVLSGHKLIPPAIGALVNSGEVIIDGFICPGHVSAIIGSKPYRFIAEKYNIPCVITGFEPLDIAEGIYMLVKQIVEHQKADVQIQYTRIVKKKGNIKALRVMNKVFKIEDSQWRGIGYILASGLKLSKPYQHFDAERNFKVNLPESKEHKGCICSEILRGVKTPLDCKLFKKRCVPENPLGACMVSSEGTCSAYYKYNRE